MPSISFARKLLKYALIQMDGWCEVFFLPMPMPKRMHCSQQRWIKLIFKPLSWQDDN
jgi:hypothetical protein